jgi:D-arabinonate dehydratase
MALWDALGKYYNAPLYKLLGGFRDRVPVIAIGGYYHEGKGSDDIREEMGYYRSQQLAGVKFCRKAAQRNLDIRWIEEPVRWYDQLEGLRLVRENAPIPVTAGQGEISRFGCRDLVVHGRVNYLNVDVTIAGGVTEWRKIAAMAEHFHVQMAHHEEAQVALHLLAAVPHSLYAEIFPNPRRDPMWFELPVERPRIRDGCMELPEGPGLGMALNEDVIERYRVAL